MVKFNSAGSSLIFIDSMLLMLIILVGMMEKNKLCTFCQNIENYCQHCDMTSLSVYILHKIGLHTYSSTFVYTLCYHFVKF